MWDGFDGGDEGLDEVARSNCGMVQLNTKSGTPERAFRPLLKQLNCGEQRNCARQTGTLSPNLRSPMRVGIQIDGHRAISFAWDGLQGDPSHLPNVSEVTSPSQLPDK